MLEVSLGYFDIKSKAWLWHSYRVYPALTKLGVGIYLGLGHISKGHLLCKQSSQVFLPILSNRYYIYFLSKAELHMLGDGADVEPRAKIQKSLDFSSSEYFTLDPEQINDMVFWNSISS